MKNQIKNLFVFAAAVLLLSITVNAQHQMNHSMNDTTKQMHHMMNDSTSMNHITSDSTSMHHMNMDHKTNMDNVKQASNKKAWNAYCPVKGGEVDPDAPTVQYKGKTIGFCCPGCDSKFMNNPEKYMKNLSEDGQKFVGKK